MCLNGTGFQTRVWVCFEDEECECIAVFIDLYRLLSGHHVNTTQCYQTTETNKRTTSLSLNRVFRIEIRWRQKRASASTARRNVDPDLQTVVWSFVSSALSVLVQLVRYLQTWNLRAQLFILWPRIISCSFDLLYKSTISLIIIQYVKKELMLCTRSFWTHIERWFVQYLWLKLTSKKA